MPEGSLRKELKREHPRIALFLDFDGTLADLALVPDGVIVEPWLPQALDRLRERLQGALAIVTGRPVSFIDDRMAPHRFDVAGLHGAEMRLAGHYEEEVVDQTPMRATVAWLKTLTEGTHFIVEDKGLSVALHWRLAPEAEELAKSLMREVQERLGKTFRLQEGKFVMEAVPAHAAKGVAIEQLLKLPAYAGRAPVFVGDDVTDEHGFAVVRGLGGYSVQVGGDVTLAQYKVRNPRAVRRHIRYWADRSL